MSYATLQNLIDRHGEGQLVLLTDHGDVATGTIDADVIARALTDTDGLIDGFLMGRYALPVTEVPVRLTDLAITIAIYKLHRSTPDQKIKDDYDDAMKALERISKGVEKLSIAGVETPSVASSGIRLTDRERPLTAENMKGYI